MKILAVIPARGGSKGIPDKNIFPLLGKPLLAYTCRAARGSRLLHRIIVSTDSPRIRKVALACGAEVPFLRPKNFSSDKAPMLGVLQHALKVLAQTESYVPDIVVLLQPTSPLRPSSAIDRAIKLLLSGKADSVVTVVRVPHHFNPESLQRLGRGGGELHAAVVSRQRPILRRQDKPVYFVRNGPAILVVRPSVIKAGKLYGRRTLALEMPAAESVDIDTPDDLALAEILLREGKGERP